MGLWMDIADTVANKSHQGGEKSDDDDGGANESKKEVDESFTAMGIVGHEIWQIEETSGDGGESEPFGKSDEHF